jgi:hypothetical protein
MEHQGRRLLPVGQVRSSALDRLAPSPPAPARGSPPAPARGSPPGPAMVPKALRAPRRESSPTSNVPAFKGTKVRNTLLFAGIARPSGAENFGASAVQTASMASSAASSSGMIGLGSGIGSGSGATAAASAAATAAASASSSLRLLPPLRPPSLCAGQAPLLGLFLRLALRRIVRGLPPPHCQLPLALVGLASVPPPPRTGCPAGLPGLPAPIQVPMDRTGLAIPCPMHAWSMPYRTWESRLTVPSHWIVL